MYGELQLRPANGKDLPLLYNQDLSTLSFMLLPRPDTIVWSFFDPAEARSFCQFLEDKGFPAQLANLTDQRFHSESGPASKTGVLIDGRDQLAIKPHLLTWIARNVHTINVRDFPSLPKFESVYGHQPARLASAPHQSSQVKERKQFREVYPAVKVHTRLQSPDQMPRPRSNGTIWLWASIGFSLVGGAFAAGIWLAGMG